MSVGTIIEDSRQGEGAMQKKIGILKKNIRFVSAKLSVPAVFLPVPYFCPGTPSSYEAVPECCSELLPRFGI